MHILSLFHERNPLALIQEYTKSLSLIIDTFTDPKEALQTAKSIKYDLLIIDIESPELLDFIRTFRHMHSAVPILVCIDANDIASQEKTLRLGAFDVVCKPLSPILLQAKLQNTLKLTKSEILLKKQKNLLQDEIKNETKTFRDSEYEMLDILAKVTQYKEHKDDKHTVRIAHYTRALARLAGLNEKIEDVAFHAAGLYDIGKASISDELLLKPQKLNENEFELIKGHARQGYDLLKYAQNSYLKAAAVISYSHHEKFDGSGYPIGLKGETIPILGRIVAIVDVFEALISKKVYKEAWSIDDACAFLIKEKGKHFDPLFVDLFIENLDEIKSIKNEFS